MSRLCEWSNVATNGSGTKNLDDMTSMLETDLSVTPIFTFSNIKGRQTRRTKSPNNKKGVSFDSTSSMGEPILIDSHLSEYDTTDTVDFNDSYPSESKYPMNKHFKDRDPLIKQTPMDVKAVVHTPPNEHVEPIHTSTPVKRQRLEQCVDNSPWFKYQSVNTDEELQRSDSFLFHTCEESPKGSEPPIVHHDTKLKGIEKLVTALAPHFSTKEFNEVKDELLCHMPCRHNSMAINNIIIHLKDGTFTFFDSWCRKCKVLLQKYDSTSTIELTELAQYVNTVNHLCNHESLIRRLCQLLERKFIKTAKR